MIHQRPASAHLYPTTKALDQHLLVLISIHVKDAISSIVHIPPEQEPVRGFNMHVSTLQESEHTISHMVRNQTRGPCKLLLQAQRPVWYSSVLVWHYQALLQNTEVVKWLYCKMWKICQEQIDGCCFAPKGAWCFYLKWVVLSPAQRAACFSFTRSE